MTTVLHVLEAVRGGTSRHLVDVVRHAGGVRHEVVVPPSNVAADQSGAPQDLDAVAKLRRAAAVVHVIDMRRSPWHGANAAAAARLRQLIATRRPDVVHGHSAVGGALARTAATGAARVYTPNGLAVGQAAVALERWLGRRTDRLIATSTSEAVQAVRLGIVPAERLAVIPNGIDLDPSPVAVVNLRSRFGLPPGTPLIGCVARLVPQKAPEQYVRACAVVAASRPDAHFVLIGMGPQQGLVDREVAAGGLTGQFHQVPHLPHAWAALGQLDVFVLPSAFEGGPYTPLEAMRAGVPVVLSDVVGNRDVVENGKSGLMAPFGASGATGAAVLRLLEDAGLRSQLTTAATERLGARFDVRLMGQALSRLYLELAAVSGPLTRRRTRRLPQLAASSSSNSPVARASQYSS